MTLSFGGMTGAGATPSSALDAATSASKASPPSMPSIPWSLAHSARTSSGAAMHVIQFTSVPPPTAVPASIVIAPSQVVSSPWLRYAPRERVQLVGRQSRLVEERPGLQDHHRPAGARQLRGDDAAARARPDDDRVRFEDDRLVATARRSRGGRATDGHAGP